MQVSFKQFLCRSHSWGNVGTNIAEQMKRLGHEIFLCSTNGYKNFPEDLKSNIVCNKCTTPQELSRNLCSLSGNFDLSIAYTMMIHFQRYLKYGRNRFGIWNSDSNVIPAGYIKNHKFATKILPSSEFARKTFESCGVPKNKLFVIPHGYNDEFVNGKSIYNINTDRKYKILVNIQQAHTRKNIPGILKTFGEAFTNKDDVSLIVKIKDKQPSQIFEISWKTELEKFYKKYKNHAPIIIINNFIDDISSLYRAVDIVFSCSNVEAFWLPGLESIVSGKITIGSGGDSCCGNIDFMNENNSLLIKGKMVRAPINYQYWKASVYAEMFEPNIDHAIELLRLSVFEHNNLLEKFRGGISDTIEKYSWSNVANQIIELCE